MISFFINAYRFFEKKTILLLILLLSVLGLGFYAITHLHLEDDITNVLPKDGELAKFEHLLEKTSTNNKLIFILKDENKNLDSLVDQGALLQSKLENIKADSLFTSINIKNDETQFISLLSNIYENLPIYLAEQDLEKINLEDSVLRTRIQKKLMVLFTPAGAMMKNSILNDPLDFGSLALKNLKSLQVDDNFTFNNSFLISKDSIYLLGFASVADNINENNKKELLHLKVTGIIDSLKAKTQIEHYVFGAAMIAQENAVRIKKDIMLTVNIALAILLIGLAFYFKSVKVLPGFVIPVVLGSAVALSFLYFNQNYVSAISLGMGSVLLGAIIDYTLHIFGHLRKTGDSKSTIKHTAGPILAGSLTTAGAFLSLLLIGSKALSDLALFAALSMLFGAIFSILVLPVLYKNTFKDKPTKNNSFDKALSYHFHKNKMLVTTCFILVFVSLFFIKKIGFVSDLNQLNYMPPYIAKAETELHKASNALQSNLLVIIEKNDINDALLATETVEKQLKESNVPVEEIKSALGLISSTKTQEERISAWKNYWTTNKIEKVKKILTEEANSIGLKPEAFNGFFNQIENSSEAVVAKQNKLTENYISIDKETGKVYSTIIVKLDKSNKDKLGAELQQLDSDIYVLDRNSAIKKLVQQVKSSLKTISIILLAVILLILFIYFKKIELVGLAFTPVALSWITTLGLMGMFNINFNMLNIIVVIFIFGLGIDYSIFILNTLLSDYTNGEKHFDTVKSSVTLSALTTFVGIGVLIFAKHPALHSIAAAGMVAILSVYTYSIILLPFLVHFILFSRINRGFEPITFKSAYDTFFAYSTLMAGVISITLLGYLLKILFFIPLHKRKLFYHKVFNLWGKSYIHIMFPGKKLSFENPYNENFSKPAVIISNHQSLIDTPLIVSLHPKLILLTKNWVRNNLVFGLGARLADFYSVEGNIEELMQNLKVKAAEGYSIAVFPEGTREQNKKLTRFYRGAFQMAYDLQMDVVPFYINGTIDTLHRKQFFGQRRAMQAVIGKRIAFNDTTFGTNNLDRYKNIRDEYKKCYTEILYKNDTVKLYEQKILSNYLYKNNGLYKKAKQFLMQFNYLNDILPLIKSNTPTLIINDNLGVVSTAVKVLSPDTEITIITDNYIFVENLYLLKTCKVKNEINNINTNSFKQVFIISNKNENEIEKIKNIQTKIILNTNDKTITKI